MSDERGWFVVSTRTGERLEVSVVGEPMTLTGEDFWVAMEAAGSGWLRPVVGEYVDTGLNDDEAE